MTNPTNQPTFVPTNKEEIDGQAAWGLTIGLMAALLLFGAMLCYIARIDKQKSVTNRSYTNMAYQGGSIEMDEKDQKNNGINIQTDLSRGSQVKTHRKHTK